MSGGRGEVETGATGEKVVKWVNEGREDFAFLRFKRVAVPAPLK